MCWASPALSCSEVLGLIFGVGWDANRVAFHQLAQQENREAETLCFPLCPSVWSSWTLKNSSSITCHLTTLPLLQQHPPSELAKLLCLSGRQGKLQPWGKAVPVLSEAAGH